MSKITALLNAAEEGFLTPFRMMRHPITETRKLLGTHKAATPSAASTEDGAIDFVGNVAGQRKIDWVQTHGSDKSRDIGR